MSRTCQFPLRTYLELSFGACLAGPATSQFQNRTITPNPLPIPTAQTINNFVILSISAFSMWTAFTCHCTYLFTVLLAERWFESLWNEGFRDWTLSLKWTNLRKIYIYLTDHRETLDTSVVFSRIFKHLNKRLSRHGKIVEKPPVVGDLTCYKALATTFSSPLQMSFL